MLIQRRGRDLKGTVKYSTKYATYVLRDTTSIADEEENIADYIDLEVIGNIWEDRGVEDENI